MKMRLLLLFMGMISVYSNAFPNISKDEYAIGKVFLVNNDTLSVYIKIDRLINLQNSIMYVDTTTGKEYILKPEKAKGFCLIYPDDTMYFESIPDFQRALFHAKYKKVFFVHCLQKGKIPLYYFVDIKLVKEGLDMVPTERGRYFALFRDEWFPVSKESYWTDSRKILSALKSFAVPKEWKDLVLKVDSSQLKFEDTIEFINLCNNLLSE